MSGSGLGAADVLEHGLVAVQRSIFRTFPPRLAPLRLQVPPEHSRASHRSEAVVNQLIGVRAVPIDVLRSTVGSQADWLHRLAEGLDDRSVTPNRMGSILAYP